MTTKFQLLSKVQKLLFHEIPFCFEMATRQFNINKFLNLFYIPKLTLKKYRKNFVPTKICNHTVNFMNYRKNQQYNRAIANRSSQDRNYYSLQIVYREYFSWKYQFLHCIFKRTTNMTTLALALYWQGINFTFIWITVFTVRVPKLQR